MPSGPSRSMKEPVWPRLSAHIVGVAFLAGIMGAKSARGSLPFGHFYTSWMWVVLLLFFAVITPGIGEQTSTIKSKERGLKQVFPSVAVFGLPFIHVLV